MMAASIPAIAPALDEALAKEMAKAGQDVSVFYDRLGWLTRGRQKTTGRTNNKPLGVSGAVASWVWVGTSPKGISKFAC